MSGIAEECSPTMTDLPDKLGMSRNHELGDLETTNSPDECLTLKMIEKVSLRNVDMAEVAYMVVEVSHNMTGLEYKEKAKFYLWLSLTFVTMGTVMNIAGVVKLTQNRRKLLFLPYLLGLCMGNLAFLTFLTYYLVCQHFSLDCSGSCRYVFYGMGSMSHIGTICLTAIAVERYFAIFCRRFISTSIRHRFRRHQVNIERHQYFTTLSLFVYCLLCFGWTVFAAESTPHGLVPNETFCGINNRVLGIPASNALMILSIVLTYFLPFFVGTTVNFALIWRLIRAPIPANFTTMVTRTGAGCSNTATYSHASNSLSSPIARTFDSRGHMALASVCISETLQARKQRTKRNVLLMFTIGMTIDLLMNFPNRFLNVANRSNDKLFQNRAGEILHQAGFFLWHIQFCVSPLFIWLPLFQRKRKLSVHHHIVDAGRYALEVDEK